MTINFTADEKQLLKFTVFDQDIQKTDIVDSELPTDIHLVEYEVAGTLYVDMVRAYKKVAIFDVYYDKIKEDGKMISISSGYGRIKPKLYGKIKN